MPRRKPPSLAVISQGGPWSRAVRAYDAEHPRYKQDGTPWVSWDEEVALRIKRKEERLAANGGVEDRTGMCTAMTTGTYGPKRPCSNRAVRGCKVCLRHGAAAKQVREAARRRLLGELDPTITRLIEIRDQNEHFPSALGASAQILNRVLGKPDSVDKEKGSGAPVINVGIMLGGLPKSAITVAAETKALPAPEEDADDAIEGEISNDGDNLEDE